jgi:hypothetical protein
LNSAGEITLTVTASNYMSVNLADFVTNSQYSRGNTFAITSGAAPPGVTLSSTGVLTVANVDVPGATTLRVTCTNEFGNTSDTSLALRPLIATGGDRAAAGAYVKHTFTTNGTFTLSGESIYADILMVGGGGGGGPRGGGGGGGGVMYGTALLNPGTFPVNVGQGGDGSPWTGASGSWNGLSGRNTFFGSFLCYGGGGGGGEGSVGVGTVGGSGGGGGMGNRAGGTAGGYATRSFKTYAMPGGSGTGTSLAAGCGGGGAGQQGSSGYGGQFREDQRAGPGGDGITIDTMAMQGQGTYGGGGGGAGEYPWTSSEGVIVGRGGAGGGGQGGVAAYSVAMPGLPNTGGGGGGGMDFNRRLADGNNAGASGGSGLVVVSFSPTTLAILTRINSNVVSGRISRWGAFRQDVAVRRPLRISIPMDGEPINDVVEFGRSGVTGINADPSGSFMRSTVSRMLDFGPGSSGFTVAIKHVLTDPLANCSEYFWNIQQGTTLQPVYIHMYRPNTNTVMRFQIAAGSTAPPPVLTVDANGTLGSSLITTWFLTYDGSTARVYKDNVQVASASNAGVLSGSYAIDNMNLSWPTADPDSNPAAAQTVHGFQAYTRVLSAAELTKLHASM